MAGWGRTHSKNHRTLDTEARARSQAPSTQVPSSTDLKTPQSTGSQQGMWGLRAERTRGFGQQGQSGPFRCDPEAWPGQALGGGSRESCTSLWGSVLMALA